MTADYLLETSNQTETPTLDWPASDLRLSQLKLSGFMLLAEFGGTQTVYVFNSENP